MRPMIDGIANRRSRPEITTKPVVHASAVTHNIAAEQLAERSRRLCFRRPRTSSSAESSLSSTLSWPRCCCQINCHGRIMLRAWRISLPIRAKAFSKLLGERWYCGASSVVNSSPECSVGSVGITGGRTLTSHGMEQEVWPRCNGWMGSDAPWVSAVCRPFLRVG